MQLDGILLVDKDPGQTSYAVVSRVKTALKAMGVRKAGHAGTLDPFATGLLILLLGQGTKLSPFLMGGKKLYRGTLRLGVETDTLDPDGAVINRRVVNEFSRKEIEAAAARQVGCRQQVPPIYSAVRCNGTRSYRLARKGLQPELRARQIEVGDFDILGVQLPFVDFEVSCSAGTYVRRLAADLGDELGAGAHLTSLRRLRSGGLDVRNALPCVEIATLRDEASIRSRLLSLNDSIPEIPGIEIDRHLADKVRKGYQPVRGDLGLEQGFSAVFPDGFAKLVQRDALVAILEIKGNQGVGYERLSIARVFS
ncbi:tRNA pseudouridine synthase B [uncultured Desulfatiglans sp.]|nr:tRNA pseudouridine synthase B [uncultured Desulfatiglans sp.]